MDIYNSESSDMHIHTLASDGILEPIEIIELANKRNLNTISITDHDSIKTYKEKGNNIIDYAKKKSINLITGIEMDSMYNDVEVHILGYDFDIHNKTLNNYLNKTALLRKQRIFEQIEKINKKKGKIVLKKEDIINKKRDTYMKPHLILALQKTEEFNKLKYQEINNWLKENIKVKTEVEKQESKFILKMIKEAGGKAYLAHPGYYIFYKPLEAEDLIIDLIKYGLDGLEYNYPYNGIGSIIDNTKEKELIKIIKNLSEKYKLKLSRGSDAHDEKRFMSFNNSKPKH